MNVLVVFLNQQNPGMVEIQGSFFLSLPSGPPGAAGAASGSASGSGAKSAGLRSLKNGTDRRNVPTMQGGKKPDLGCAVMSMRNGYCNHFPYSMMSKGLQQSEG